MRGSLGCRDRLPARRGPAMIMIMIMNRDARSRPRSRVRIPAKKKKLTNTKAPASCLLKEPRRDHIRAATGTPPSGQDKMGAGGSVTMVVMDRESNSVVSTHTMTPAHMMLSILRRQLPGTDSSAAFTLYVYVYVCRTVGMRVVRVRRSSAPCQQHELRSDGTGCLAHSAI